jgi:NAD-dependent dihydropyrimidine dehydrogenase PreA subunit
MKTMRKIIEIDEELCDGCGQCVPSCAEGALEIIDGKARMIAEIYCDGLGACLGECPQGALRIIEREAEEFDPEAVEEFLMEKEQAQESKTITLGAGCPSSRIETFEVASQESTAGASQENIESALSHWPVQINLVPPTAPFLKGAHLLVAADCAPIAYPNFHRDFLKDRVVLIGCPKFDNVQDYVQKFAEIFKQTHIRSITVLDMEVPCCSALPVIVLKGMEAAQVRIPMEEIVISARGKIVEKRKSAA